MPSATDDILRQAAEEQAPEAARKRTRKARASAPDRSLSREERRARQERVGKAAGFRIQPATHEAMKQAARENHVKIGQLADFFLLKMLAALEAGVFELPVTGEPDTAGRYDLEMPELPDRFEG